MEPDQELPSRPQRIPSAARHHACPYVGLTSSSPSLCDKRLIRRSTHGTPYPQAISISPPPPYLALLPASSSRKADGVNENNNSNNNNIDNGGVAPGRSPATTPGATTPAVPFSSPFSPPPIIKTTSFLARRRRSTISSSPPSSSPEMKSIPPPPILNPSTPLTTARQQFQQHVKHQSPSVATTPDYSASNFWASGSAGGKDSGSSLFVKDSIGLGGSWLGWSTANRAAASNAPSKVDNNQVPPVNDSREVSVELEEAMDEDESSDDDEPPKPAFPHTQSRVATGIGNSYSNHGVDVATENVRREAEDSLARIAQAMTLLSLGPPSGPSDHFPNGYPAQQDGWPPHPTPESLLRESLRQSFEAYKILKELDKRTVFGGAGARQNSVSLPALSRRQSLRVEDEDREISVVDVLRAYDKAAEGVKTAREVMKWAEHWIREEGERTRERLLKG